MEQYSFDHDIKARLHHGSIGISHLRKYLLAPGDAGNAELNMRANNTNNAPARNGGPGINCQVKAGLSATWKQQLRTTIKKLVLEKTYPKCIVPCRRQDLLLWLRRSYPDERKLHCVAWRLPINIKVHIEKVENEAEERRTES